MVGHRHKVYPGSRTTILVAGTQERQRKSLRLRVLIDNGFNQPESLAYIEVTGYFLP